MNRHGLTLIELLVAVVLLGTAIAGLVALFSFGFQTTRHSQDVAIAYNVARQEVEKARNVGFSFLPELSWTAYYDGLGNQTIDPNPHFIADIVVTTIPDENGEINMTCLRTVTVEVRARENNELLFETTSYLTRSGV